MGSSAMLLFFVFWAYETVPKQALNSLLERNKWAENNAKWLHIELFLEKIQTEFSSVFWVRYFDPMSDFKKI